MKPQELPPVLTIAGSDSGGAAGLQADLRTWALLGVYGLCAITAVTVQNSLHVKGVQSIAADFVAAQMNAVLSDYGAAAVKTGFLGRVDLIRVVAAQCRRYQLPNVVVDPVLVNHKGQAMFPPEVTEAYVSHLLPLADLLTPNRREAELLTGLPVNNVDDMETAAVRLHALGAKNCLIKGGLDGEEMVDIFYDGRSGQQIRSSRIHTPNTHGSGDTLSAAICAYLARDLGMETAVHQAHHFTHRAIGQGAGWQLGHGHGPVAPW